MPNEEDVTLGIESARLTSLRSRLLASTASPVAANDDALAEAEAHRQLITGVVTNPSVVPPVEDIASILDGLGTVERGAFPVLSAIRTAAAESGGALSTGARSLVYNSILNPVWRGVTGEEIFLSERNQIDRENEQRQQRILDRVGNDRQARIVALAIDSAVQSAPGLAATLFGGGLVGLGIKAGAKTVGALRGFTKGFSASAGLIGAGQAYDYAIRERQSSYIGALSYATIVGAIEGGAAVVVAKPIEKAVEAIVGPGGAAKVVGKHLQAGVASTAAKIAGAGAIEELAVFVATDLVNRAYGFPAASSVAEYVDGAIISALAGGLLGGAAGVPLGVAATVATAHRTKTGIAVNATIGEIVKEQFSVLSRFRDRLEGSRQHWIEQINHAYVSKGSSNTAMVSAEALARHFDGMDEAVSNTVVGGAEALTSALAVGGKVRVNLGALVVNSAVAGRDPSGLVRHLTTDANAPSVHEAERAIEAHNRLALLAGSVAEEAATRLKRIGTILSRWSSQDADALIRRAQYKLQVAERAAEELRKRGLDEGVAARAGLVFSAFLEGTGSGTARSILFVREDENGRLVQSILPTADIDLPEEARAVFENALRPNTTTFNVPTSSDVDAVRSELERLGFGSARMLKSDQRVVFQVDGILPDDELDRISRVASAYIISAVRIKENGDLDPVIAGPSAINETMVAESAAGFAFVNGVRLSNLAPSEVSFRVMHSQPVNFAVLVDGVPVPNEVLLAVMEAAGESGAVPMLPYTVQSEMHFARAPELARAADVRKNDSVGYQTFVRTTEALYRAAAKHGSVDPANTPEAMFNEVKKFYAHTPYRIGDGFANMDSVYKALMFLYPPDARGVLAANTLVAPAKEVVTRRKYKRLVRWAADEAVVEAGAGFMRTEQGRANGEMLATATTPRGMVYRAVEAAAKGNANQIEAAIPALAALIGEAELQAAAPALVKRIKDNPADYLRKLEAAPLTATKALFEARARDAEAEVMESPKTKRDLAKETRQTWDALLGATPPPPKVGRLQVQAPYILGTPPTTKHGEMIPRPVADTSRGSTYPPQFITLTPEADGRVLAHVTAHLTSIVIRKSGDVSTLLHEAAHVWLFEATAALHAGKMPKEATEVFAEMLGQLGVPGRSSEERLKWWLAETPGLNVTPQARDIHERFASAFEAFLIGNEAGGSLDVVGSTLRDAVTAVYRDHIPDDIKRAMEASPGLNIIHDLFHGLIEAQNIAAATMLEALGSPHIRAVTLAVSPEEEEAARPVNQDKNTEEALKLAARLMSRTHEQMAKRAATAAVRSSRWFLEAFRASMGQAEMAMADLYRERFVQIAQEMSARPEYQAMHFLKTGETPSRTTGPIPLVNEDSLIALFADNAAILGKILSRFRKNIVPEGGSDAGVIAAMFGAPSPEAFWTTMATLPNLTTEAGRLARQFVYETYGALSRADLIAKAATDAMASMDALTATVIEGEAFSGRDMKTVESVAKSFAAAYRHAAKRTVNAMPLGSISPEAFMMTANNHHKDAVKAIAENNIQEARVAKQKEAMSRALALEAAEVERRITGALETVVARLAKTRDVNLAADDRRALLTIFNAIAPAAMASRQMPDSENLPTFSDAVERVKESAIEMDMDPSLLIEAVSAVSDARARGEPVTAGDLLQAAVATQSMMKMMTALFKEGRNNNKDFVATTASQMARTIRENVPPNKRDLVNTFEDNKKSRSLAGFMMNHRSWSSVWLAADGGKRGVLFDFFVLPLQKAFDTEVEMKRQLAQKLEPYVKLLLGTASKRTFNLRDGRRLTFGSAVGVALNAGNAENLDRMMRGNGITSEDVAHIMSNMTADELRSIQAIWDIIDSLWPQIEAKERRLYGLAPKRVEATPMVIQSADGETVALRGGYYPIIDDPSQATSSLERAARDAADGINTFRPSTTFRGYTKARGVGVGDPIALDPALLFDHLEAVVHDLTHHEPLLQIRRFLASKPVVSAIRETLGPEYLAWMRSTLDDIAAGGAREDAIGLSLIRTLRSNTTRALIGASMASVLAQPFGIATGAAHIGPQWILAGAATLLTSPLKNEISIREKSVFMKNRSKTRFIDLFHQQQMIRQGATMTNFRRGLDWLAMGLLHYTQNIVDSIIWLGAYKRALAENNAEERAVALADDAVRVTQGGSAIVDMPKVLYSRSAVGLLSVLMQYFNTAYNLFVAKSAPKIARHGKIVGGMWAFAYLMTIFAIPNFLEGLLRDWLRWEFGSADEERRSEEDQAKFIRNLAVASILSPLNGIVLFREFVPVLTQESLYAGPAGLTMVSSGVRWFSRAYQGMAVDENSLDRALESGDWEAFAEEHVAAFKAANMMAGAMLGYPAAQINRLITYIHKAEEEELPWTAAIFGLPER